ncbi:HAD hydrolase-like protein [uncultured Amaricoccus sp.]|uniref:HAD hydrolase-like protein n=1 Tax=uncultured Amaricoccus sp. TaxID=339341 RepID=UPI00261F15CF|nr:HAD hydrolase-like protein [uncultured Amaricoccus sp.]
MRAAVFDLDGTLADTSADLIAAANGALAEAGVGARLDAADGAEPAVRAEPARS